jgi:tetratricopeptide (TPR) repeat protein
MKTSMRLRTLTAFLFISAAPVLAAIGTAGKVSSFENLVLQGRAAFLVSDLDRAEAAYNEACPADLVGTFAVAKAVTCENLLASVDEARGNLSRAEQRYLHAVAGAEQAGPAYRPLYCARLIDLGEHYRRQGDADNAESTLLKAVALARTIGVERPELLPEALIRLGGAYAASTQPERGRDPLTEALTLINEGARPPNTEIGYAHDRLGMIELAAGHQREAESHLRQSVALATEALGEDHPVTAAYETNLALSLIVAREFDRAAMLLRRAQFVVESKPNASGSELATIYAEMSEVTSVEGKTATAEDYALRAISILNMQPKPDPRAAAAAEVTLAEIYLRTHDIASAEKILPNAVKAQRASATNASTLGASIRLLGDLRAQERNWQAAEALYREAIELHEKSAGADPTMASLLHALADTLRHEGKSKDEIRSLEARAHATAPRG